jgi:hypothetical protein
MPAFIRKNSRTWSWSIHKPTNKEEGYFFVESVIFLVLSIDILVESGMAILVVSVFTAAESVVVVEEEPDPQAAKTLTANTVNNFFILKN